MVVERNSSPITTAPAGILIGPISIYLPVLTLILIGVSAGNVASTYSAANLTDLNGLSGDSPYPLVSIPWVPTNISPAVRK